MNRLLIIIPALIILSAITLMACKSSENSANNGTEGNLDNVESIGIEKTSEMDQVADQQDNDGSVANAKTAKQSTRDLVGTWKWVKTACCGRTMGETFPKEDEPDRIIAFDLDGNARYFTDGTKEKVTDQPFRIGSLGPQQPTIKIGELQPAIFLVDGNTLVLSWGYMDLQMEYYERVK